MKKTISIILTITMMLAIVFATACTPEDSAATDQGSQSKNDVPDINNPIEDEKFTEGLHYELLEDGTYGVKNSAMTKELTDIVIPDSYDGKPVTKILSAGFAGAIMLQTIKLPDSITTIEGNAFKGCTALKSINIPNGVTVISSGAFWQCSSLRSIDLPDSVTAISSRAFMESGLKEINIPKSVRSISFQAFQYCIHLESIAIPEGVTSIAEKTFVDCIKLKEIYIPLSLNSIAQGAFSNCYDLDNVYYAGSYEDFIKIENARQIQLSSSGMHYNYTPETNE